MLFYVVKNDLINFETILYPTISSWSLVSSTCSYSIP